MAKDLVYVPGYTKCPKCGFRLVSNVINMASGSISATKPSDRQTCSNCPNVLMEPITWREHAEDMEKKVKEFQHKMWEAQAHLINLELSNSKR